MLFWVGFHIAIALLLYCDFLFFRRQKDRFSHKQARRLSEFWILLALLFNGLIYFTHGSSRALEFFTAYLVEKSLSLDNLFVFLLLFRRFKLSAFEQHKVLFWGILGAIVFRIIFILLGIRLLMAVHWMTYLFGVFLLVTGIKILMQPRKEPQLESNWFVRLCSFLPMTKQTAHSAFFVREGGKLKMTFLFSILLLIESTDILFAMDSIPAVLAITTDPFIAYTSNIFAILGLRALYFALFPFLEKWKYLNVGLSAILIFVGAKMFFSSVYNVPLAASLLVIVAILCITGIASRVKNR
jgi:tellurite resistance protein TerC